MSIFHYVIITYYLLGLNFQPNSVSASTKQKMSLKCQAAVQECSLLKEDVLKLFQTNICENVKNSMECFTKRGCPEGEPRLKSLHDACGELGESIIKVETKSTSEKPAETLNKKEKEEKQEKTSETNEFKSEKTKPSKKAKNEL